METRPHLQFNYRFGMQASPAPYSRSDREYAKSPHSTTRRHPPQSFVSGPGLGISIFGALQRLKGKLELTIVLQPLRLARRWQRAICLSKRRHGSVVVLLVQRSSDGGFQRGIAGQALGWQCRVGVRWVWRDRRLGRCGINGILPGTPTETGGEQHQNRGNVFHFRKSGRQWIREYRSTNRYPGRRADSAVPAGRCCPDRPCVHTWRI